MVDDTILKMKFNKIYIIKIYIINIVNPIIITTLPSFPCCYRKQCHLKTVKLLCTIETFEIMCHLCSWCDLLRLKCQVKVAEKRKKLSCSQSRMRQGLLHSLTWQPPSLDKWGKRTERQHLHRNILQVLLCLLFVQVFLVRNPNFSSEHVFMHIQFPLLKQFHTIWFSDLQQIALYISTQTRKTGKLRELFSVTEKEYTASVYLQDSLVCQYIDAYICIFKINTVFNFYIINSLFSKSIAQDKTVHPNNFCSLSFFSALLTCLELFSLFSQKYCILVILITT